MRIHKEIRNFKCRRAKNTPQNTWNEIILHTTKKDRSLGNGHGKYCEWKLLNTPKVTAKLQTSHNNFRNRITQHASHNLYYTIGCVSRLLRSFVVLKCNIKRNTFPKDYTCSCFYTAKVTKKKQIMYKITFHNSPELSTTLAWPSNC